MSTAPPDMTTYLSEDKLFSFSINPAAEKYLLNVLSVPYLRVSVKKGGCSGSMYAFDETQAADSTLDYIFPLSENFAVIVYKKEALATLKSLVCQGIEHSSGFVIKWSHQVSGTVCGCGESFE